MKILVVGSGGREHTMAWKFAASPLVKEVLAAPGSVGIATEQKCRVVGMPSDDIAGLRQLAVDEKVDLTVVGPEAPLVAGLVDVFRQSGLNVFGPSGKAAALEGSKVFAKGLMKKYGIPSAEFEVFDDFAAASDYLAGISHRVVVKADGLAAGKGVFVCADKSEALTALTSIMKERIFGNAGNRVVIEECLEGEEASFIAFTDGKTVVPLASSQDHKAIFDNDRGPNTGGMGAYSPAPVVTPQIHDQIMNKVMIPVIKALEAEGAPYMGFLYAGLMIKDGEAKVLEFNARMGDPEAQPLLFRMASDVVPLVAAATDGRLASAPPIDWLPEAAVCVVMASAGYPGPYEKGRPIKGIEDADSMDGVKVFHAGTGRSGDRFVTTGGRVLGVTARAAEIGAAIEKAYAAVGKIHWEGAQYRTDIGKKALNRK